MLSLNAWERGLFLPQLNVSDLVDSSWEPLPIGRMDERVGWGGRTVIGMQNTDKKGAVLHTLLCHSKLDSYVALSHSVTNKDNSKHI